MTLQASQLRNQCQPTFSGKLNTKGNGHSSTAAIIAHKVFIGKDLRCFPADLHGIMFFFPRNLQRGAGMFFLGLLATATLTPSPPKFQRHAPRSLFMLLLRLEQTLFSHGLRGRLRNGHFCVQGLLQFGVGRFGGGVERLHV